MINFALLKQLLGYSLIHRRLQTLSVVCLIILTALAESVTIGAVVPLVSFISNQEAMLSNNLFISYLEMLSTFINVDDMTILVISSFAIIVILATIIRLLGLLASTKLVNDISFDLSIDIFNKSLNQPYEYHLSQNSSEVIAGINKVMALNGGVFFPMIQAITGLLVSASIVIILFIIDAVTAAILGISFLIIYTLILALTRYILNRNSISIAKVNSSRIRSIQESWGAIRDIIIGQLHTIYIDFFKSSESEFKKASIQNAFISASPKLFIEGVGILILLGVILYLSSKHGIQGILPSIAAIALGSQKIIPAFQQLFNAWSRLAGNRQLILDVLELLELKLDIRGNSNTKIVKFNEAIVLEDVNFKYVEGDDYILKDINLCIQKGQSIGIIGSTGSGKTSLVDLIMGLILPSSGKMYVDDQEINSTSLASWQSFISHVPQHIFLSDASIIENIAFGKRRKEIDIDRINTILKVACLDKLVDDLPDGLNTKVGERGARLSGGQIQRIGIARALYYETALLVLDEATSALDSNTEAAVMENIQSFDSDITIIMIAHRLSTLTECNKIVELDKGRIISQ